MMMKYDKYGWDKNGINKETGTIYDKDGYDIKGWNKDNINKLTGTKYDIDGFNKSGFNKEGIHKSTGTRYNREGYDKNGVKIKNTGNEHVYNPYTRSKVDLGDDLGKREGLINGDNGWTDPDANGRAEFDG